MRRPSVESPVRRPGAPPAATGSSVTEGLGRLRPGGPCGGLRRAGRRRRRAARWPASRCAGRRRRARLLTARRARGSPTSPRPSRLARSAAAGARRGDRSRTGRRDALRLAFAIEGTAGDAVRAASATASRSRVTRCAARTRGTSTERASPRLHARGSAAAAEQQALAEGRLRGMLPPARDWSDRLAPRRLTRPEPPPPRRLPSSSGEHARPAPICTSTPSTRCSTARARSTRSRRAPPSSASPRSGSPTTA